MTAARMMEDIWKLHALVLPIDGRYAEALGDIIQFARNDDARFWESINDNLIRGGSGSLADQFLAINPGSCR